MKIEKTMGIVSGATCMGLMLLLVWYLIWDARADAHIAAVTDSITRQEAVWNQNGGQVSLRYADLFASGFPFHTKIRLLQPQLRATIDNRKLLVFTTYLDFVPDDHDSWRYKLEFLPDFTIAISDNRNDDYSVHLYELPQVLVHAPPGAEIAASRPGEYGVTLPPKLMLGIQHGEIIRKIAFQYIASSEPLWRYVPKDVHDPLRTLLSILEQATVSGIPG